MAQKYYILDSRTLTIWDYFMSKSRLLFALSKKNLTFANQKGIECMTRSISQEQMSEFVDQSGILIVREMSSFFDMNEDFVFPHIILTLCLSGSARAKYDMRVITHHKNDLAIILPGHIMHPMDCTDDFTYALLFISPKVFDDLRFNTFSHDYEKFNYSPVCSLTDGQAKQLLAILEQLIEITNRTEKELPHRHQTLMAQLAVGYEFLNYYRREQDKQWRENRHVEIFNRFCDLVVKHYRESREIQYYAHQLNLTPKYFSKIIRQATDGLSPAEWIAQYVVAQAKRLIESHSSHTLQEIAYMLGFSEPTAFYRYFKRVTGMTAKEYRESIILPH